MKGWCRLAALVGVSLAAACGGGGGGGSASAEPEPSSPPAARFSLAQTTLNFVVDNPAAGVPEAQTVSGSVTGTIDGTTLYILIEAVGTIIDQISNVVISGNSGTATVTPVHPLSLGAGSYSGMLTVRACVDSPSCATGQIAGSPRTITVNYTIGSSVQQDAVMPRVVAADAAGPVILRGTGLEGVTSVSFGGTPGTGVEVLSDTEVAVTHPALAAGSHALSLNGGTIPFAGTLVAAPVTAYAEQILSYPGSDTPLDIGAVLFDAEREALLVVIRYDDAGDASANNHILRYAYNGTGWDAPTSETIFRLRDIALSNRGDRLLALSESALAELDPATLAQITSTTNLEILNGPAGAFMRYLAMSNDGYAFIAGDWRGTGSTPAYLYSLTAAPPSFTNLEHRTGSVLLGTNAQIGRTGRNGTAASGDGSRVAVVYGDRQSLDYAAGKGSLLPSPLDFAEGSYNYRAALDTSGTRMIVSNGVETRVYTGDNTLFCTLPADTRAYTVDPAGTRGYVVDLASDLLVFDLATATNGGPCLQIGIDTPIFDVGVDPTGFGFADSLIRMTTSPDGQTLFIAGLNGILVRPAPQ